MLTTLNKFPAPYFGGKSKAAPAIWDALGDVHHYVEPFCGSCAVLLNRPHEANRAYFSETINDADGLLVNALRSMQLHPDATADAASWYVSETDLTARHLAIVKWMQDKNFEMLMGDPGWCDPTIAGWWLWGMSAWIGGEWCTGDGPWTTDENGRIFKQPPARGRKPGVSKRRPPVTANGRGVNNAVAREPGVEDADGFHPMTMPEVLRWLRFLSARLRHVRILCGDWHRLVTKSASLTLSVRQKPGAVCGVFLDPPYSAAAGRDNGLYRKDSTNVACDARDWAIANGDNPKYRIVFAGFEGEHGTAFAEAGWRELEWFSKGFLTGGMGNLSKQKGKGHQQHRERLWLSPHCLSPHSLISDERTA